MSYTKQLIDISDSTSLPEQAQVINDNLTDIETTMASLGGGSGLGAFDFVGTSPTGGTSEDLDSVDGSSLSGGERALLTYNNEYLLYILDPTSGAAESSPDIIAPDTNPGTKRWILRGKAVLFGTASGTAAEGNDARLPTSDQKAALAGTAGSPGAANKYVTDSDSRNNDARTPTAHTTSHKHGGSDEVATATAAANAIPKAGADGKLDAGWIPTIDGGTV